LLHRLAARVVVVAATTVGPVLLCLQEGHVKGLKPKYDRNDRRARVEGALIGIGGLSYLELEEFLAAEGGRQPYLHTNLQSLTVNWRYFRKIRPVLRMQEPERQLCSCCYLSNMRITVRVRSILPQHAVSGYSLTILQYQSRKLFLESNKSSKVRCWDICAKRSSSITRIVRSQPAKTIRDISSINSVYFSRLQKT